MRLGRLFALAFGTILLLGIVGYLGFRWWLQAYLRSERFRLLLNEKTSAALHVDGQFMPLHWNGASVYTDGFEGRGQPGGWLTDLRADQIRAELRPRGWFRRDWRLQDLSIQRLNLAFSPKGRQATNSGGAGQSGVSFPPPSVVIQEANLRWSTGSVRQARLQIEPDGRAWNVTGTGGELRLADWPVLQIENCRIRCESSHVFITEANLRYGEAGRLALNGDIGLGDTPAVNLLIKPNGIPVSAILPDDWRARLTGTLVGEAQVTRTAGELTATGTVSLVAGHLEALPVLDRIATFTRTEEFRRLALQTAKADFVWQNEGLDVKQLVLVSEGLLRIEGGFTLKNGIVEGQFQVGVTPQSLKWLPGSRERVFTNEHDGYVWTPVRVTGPVDKLQEDLSARLITAAGTELLSGVESQVEQGAKELLNLLQPLLR